MSDHEPFASAAPAPDPQPIPAMASRISWLDRAKGIGICLVVLGHCLGGLMDAGALPIHGGAASLFASIYTFHMPLFFFLSSVLVPRRIKKSPSSFARSMVRDIAWPYFLWGAIQSLVIRMAASFVNHPPQTAVGDMLVKIIWSPPSQFWFLYVLFLLHACTMVALPRLRGGGWFLLAVLLALFLTETSGWVVLPMIGNMIVWYAAGSALEADGVDRFVKATPRWFTLVAVLGLVTTLAIAGPATQLASDSQLVASDLANRGFSIGNAFFAILGIGSVILIAGHLPVRTGIFFDYLGRRSMPIYVLHILALAPLRIVLLRAGLAPNVVLISCFIVGILAPLFAFEVLARVRLTRILGLGRP